MRPTALCLIKDSHMLHFSIAGYLLFDSFFGINFHDTILHWILNLCKHVITVTMDDLDKFTHLTA